MKAHNRRSFLKTAAIAGTAAAGISSATSAPKNILSPDRMGVLIDTTVAQAAGSEDPAWRSKNHGSHR